MKNNKIFSNNKLRLKILKEAYKIYKRTHNSTLSKYKRGLCEKGSDLNISICEAIVRSNAFNKEVEKNKAFIGVINVSYYFPELMKVKPHRKLQIHDYWWVKDCTKNTRDKVFEKMIKELEEKI